jgi:hypothetical protein
LTGTVLILTERAAFEIAGLDVRSPLRAVSHAVAHVQIPMQCGGNNFLEAAKREMPEKLNLCTTGSRFTFSA